MPGRQYGKTDALTKDLQAQLDAVTKERDALRAVCRNAWAFLEGWDSVAKIQDRQLVTDSPWIQALREVPKP